MSSPQISVVMPVWNGERYLREAVESVLAQTFTDLELVVVDDGSTDRTMNILAECKDPRLRVFHLTHLGISPARNCGITQARAPWIAVHDADDVSLPQRLMVQWRAVHRKPGTVLCYSNAEYIGERAGAVRRAWLPRKRAFLALKLCFQNPIVHSTVLLNKKSFLAAGGYAVEDWEAVDDYGLWGRLIERGEVIGIPERLLKLRLHGRSSSVRLSQEQMAAARRTATANCQRFLGLSGADAQRARTLLSTLPRERQWSDWWWFLTRCAPRLRWKSTETAAWLASQTLRYVLRR